MRHLLWRGLNVIYEKASKESGVVCWKGGTYNGEGELLSRIFSCDKVGTNAGLIDAGCNAGDEHLAFAEAGIVSC